ncbi:MAG: hypothetical protein M3498_04045 [Deinococcota bacterium]|nr:hypothetical protein [Deinococcota bacterium]
MGGLIRFLVIGAIIFFGVGEWQGWYLGVAPYTPVLVYKKDHVFTYNRQRIADQPFPVDFRGRLRRGRVTVEGYYERPASLQTGQRGTPPRRIFSETFEAGQLVSVVGEMRQGRGIYTVRVSYEDATGLFRLARPAAETVRQ